MTITITILRTEVTFVAGAADKLTAMFAIANDAVTPGGPFLSGRGGIPLTTANLQTYLDAIATDLWNDANQVQIPYDSTRDPIDMHLFGDAAGVDQRRRAWFEVTDDFNSFNNWTWASNLFYDGTPATVSATAYDGLLYLAHNDNTKDFFAYRAATGSTSVVAARIAKQLGPYCGVRIDDGGAGSENSFELRMVDSATAPFLRLQWRAVTAGTPTTGYYADLLPPGFYILQIARTTGATWTGFGYLTKDSPIPLFSGATVASQTWTPARAGLTFGTSANATQVGLVDWIRSN